MWIKNFNYELIQPRIIFGTAILSLFILIGLFGKSLAPFSIEDSSIRLRLAPPSIEHWLGCDSYGIDLLSSILAGASTTLYVSIITLALSFTIGVALGLLSGFFGGWVDNFIMRVVDILMAFPGILLAMALAASMGPSLHNIIFSISATGWTSSARLVRGQVLTLKEREFLIAARSIGASPIRQMLIHILPNLISHLLVSATFSLSGVILVESSLSFLGLGAQDSSQTWGSLLSQGKPVLLEAPHISIFPGLCIMTLVIALNFLGDGLRDVLDPKE